MKAQIRAKTRNRGRGWAEYRRPDEKKGVPGAESGRRLEMLLVLLGRPAWFRTTFSDFKTFGQAESGCQVHAACNIGDTFVLAFTLHSPQL
jgi:hypothetical protein